MTMDFIVHDPTLFVVWARIHPGRLRQAAEHLVKVSGALSIHQFHQLAKRMSAENRPIEVCSKLSYLQAHEKANSLPEGFVVGSAS